MLTDVHQLISGGVMHARVEAEAMGTSDEMATGEGDGGVTTGACACTAMHAAQLGGADEEILAGRARAVTKSEGWEKLKRSEVGTRRRQEDGPGREEPSRRRARPVLE